MFFKIVITFFLIIISQFVHSAPNLKTFNFKSLKKSLPEYSNSLLNEQLLGFLNTTCFSSNCCNKGDSLLCPFYFELVKLLHDRHLHNNITSQQLGKIIGFDARSPVNITGFCLSLSRRTNSNTISSLKDEVFIPNAELCEVLCTKAELNKETKTLEVGINPLCAFISWMSEEICLNEDKKSLDVNKTKYSSGNESITLSNNLTNANIISSNIKQEAGVPLENADNNKISEPEIKINPTSTLNAVVDHIPVTVNTSTNKDIGSVSKTQIDSNVKTEKIEKIEKISDIGKVEEQEKKLNKENEHVESKPKPNINTEEQDENKLNITEDEKKLETENKNVMKNSNTNKKHLVTEKQEITSSSQDGFQDDDMDPLKNKEDLIMKYSDDEDDSTTNDIFKTNLSPEDPAIDIKDRQIENHESNLISSDPFYQESGSNFFFYFLITMFACIILYVMYHNKTKILAIMIEGRRLQNGKNRRKRSSGGYRKLDTNLEEAITSTSCGQTAPIIY